MKHASLYDRLTKTASKFITSLNPFAARRAGEQRYTKMIAPYGSSRYGTYRVWDKVVQIQHFRSWVARCVEFLSEGTRMPPEIVRVTPGGERARMGVAVKEWRRKGCVGEFPGNRKFVSAVRQKNLVGPVSPNEEYEYLPNDHPAVRLVNDPNEPWTGIKFWQLMGTYEELTGEAFLWIVENGAGVPVELWVLPSQWVTPRNIGKSGKLVDYFEVRSVNGPVEFFDPAEIIWSKNDSPWHPLFANSRVQNASTTIDAYEMTETARYAGLENGVSAGGAITMPPDVIPTQEVLDRIEARFLAKFGGVANAGRPLILEGGLEWTPPTAAAELAFLQSEDQLRKYIMAQFGLDESMMGFANHTTYAAAVITERMLFKSVFGPRLENRAALLTERLLPRFGPDLRAVYTPSTATQDPDAKRQDWQLATNARAVTVNEIRTELLGLEPVDDPAADELPSDPLTALGGDMTGWDAEPGQTQGVERPGFTAFGGGGPDDGPKGLTNRIAELNGASLNGKH